MPMVQTHNVRISGALVTKRYVDWARGEHLREWAALQLISTAKPDLVPRPLRCSWDSTSGSGRGSSNLSSFGDGGFGADGAGGPSILMRLVPGRPLGGALTPEELAGLETALRELWSTPAEGLLPISYSAFADRVRRSMSTWRGTGIIGEAQTVAREWLSSGVIDQYYEPSVPVVGHGDPNLSNYLWDGSQVRIIDSASRPTPLPTLQLPLEPQVVLRIGGTSDTIWGLRTGYLLSEAPNSCPKSHRKTGGVRRVQGGG
jgi:hypothetical protein